MVSRDQGRQCHSRPPKHFILKSSKKIAEQEPSESHYGLTYTSECRALHFSYILNLPAPSI